MDINWTTFLLEGINFLVLVWILKRFFYKPVLDAVERRRQGIQDSLAQAETLREEALDLKSTYEKELRTWAEEQEARLLDLQETLNTERDQALANLKVELDEEREKRNTQEQAETERTIRRYQAQALEHGGRFVSKMLNRLVCPQLEEHLIEWFEERIQDMPQERWEVIRNTGNQDPVVVVSANSLSIAQRKRLVESILTMLGREAEVEFSEAPDLLAGVRVQIGSWILDANLREELRFFTSFNQDTAIEEPTHEK